MKKAILLLLILGVAGNMVYAQARRQNHRVFFEDKDKFSGYVEFNTVVKSTPTRVVVENDPKLVITGYNATDEEIAALNKAGLPLKRFTGNFTPEKYQFYAVGRAYIITRSDFNATEKSTLIIGNGKGTYTTPVFSDFANKRSEEWNKKNKEKTFWETYGGFNAEEVTELHLPELKYQIRQILGKYKSDLEFFKSKITAGTSYANGFNFPGAEEALELAKGHSNESADHRSKISQLEKLIAKKKKEKEENDKQEKEKERKKDEAEKSTPSGKKTEGVATLKTKSSEKDGTGSEDASSDDESGTSSGSTSKKNTTTYVPKTAGQMHADLKSMVARNPEMMNDPKVRQQLRHLEVDANREQQTLRDFRAGVYNHGNYQAAAAHIATNRRVDAYTKAGGDITDAVSGLVGSILAESERKSEQRRLEIQARTDSYNAKVQALRNYREEVRKERNRYTEEVRRKLENKYNYVFSSSLQLITYLTEVEDKDNIDRQAFKKEKVSMGYAYAYLIEENGLYGLAADDGSIIYPPQFNAIIPIKFDEISHNSFLIKIEDKWGEIDPSGKIIEEVKYDGLWYILTRKKIRQTGNQIELVESGGKVTTFSKAELANSLIVVMNTNEDGSPGTSIVRGFYVLDFVKGIYSAGYAKSKNATEMVCYDLNGATSTYTDGIYINNNAYLFKKDDIWYRLDVVTGPAASYNLRAMPETFVIAVSNAYLNGKVGETKWGAINEKGETVIPFEHKYLKDFKDGMAASDKGAYNESGKLLFSGNYDSVAGFERGVAFFKYKDPKTYKTEVGLVTEDGRELIRTNANVYKGDDGWYVLGVRFREEKSNENKQEAAIYCFEKIQETSPLYAIANKAIGDIYYHQFSDYEAAYRAYQKSFKSGRWQFYLKNMKRSFHSPKGKSQYQTEYFSEVSSYTHLIYTIGWMNFRGQGTEKSLVKAQDMFSYLISTGVQIVEEFKYDSPPNRNQKPVDLSAIYNRIGEAYEHNGDLKNAKKYYKLATARKTESQVKLANTRLNALKNGTHYNFYK